MFDSAGQQTALIDALNHRQSFTYDAAGRQRQQIDALGRRTTLGYDAAGQQTLRLDARGYRTTYSYDQVSQVVARQYPDGSRATLAYDLARNRTKMQDSTGRYTFVYDPLDRTSVARNPQNKSLTYTYDSVGNRRSMQTADSGRFSYTYNAVNQNTEVLNPLAERSSFSYDAAGKMTLRRLSNGTRTSYVYDANDRRTSVDNRTSAGAAIATFDYLYDNVGNPTRVVEASGDRVTWIYDADNKLLSERRSGASSYANTFSYDAVGIRTLKNSDTVRTTFAYDSANQLLYSQVTAGRTTFSYDASGNQTLEQPPAGARTTTTWNYENQPSVVLLPDSTRMTLAYNADNRRVQRQRGSETLKFVWDPVADAYQSELDAANVTQAVYTQPPAPFGQLISQRRGATSSWFHPDSLGSTRALTDSGQTTTDTYLYDAWGNPLSSSGTTVNPFRWVGAAGYYFDTASGLYYIRARLYQPTIARWTSTDPLFYMLARSGMIGLGSNDPIGPFAGFSDGIKLDVNTGNLYSYVSGSPVLLVDPSGMVQKFCGQYCGPDATGLLAQELRYASNFWASHMRYWSSGFLRIRVYLGWVRWYHMLQIGHQLDWTQLYSEEYADAEGMLVTCPSKNCKETYEICDVCVHNHFIGNIMFGYWARLHGIVDTAANFAAHMAQLFGQTNSRGFDKPWDQAGYELGRILAEADQSGLPLNESTVCALLNGSYGNAFGYFTMANQTGKDYHHCGSCPRGLDGGIRQWEKRFNGGYPEF